MSFDDKYIILHFEFKFPAKNSEFFRFKCLNFPPKNLDVIVVVVGVGVVGGRCDNRGTSFNWHFSVKPINDLFAPPPVLFVLCPLCPVQVHAHCPRHHHQPLE